MPYAMRPEILVVDDEALIRAVLEQVLRQAGFAVRLAGDGAEAIDLYQRYHAEIGLVLLDVRMSGRDGPQTLSALKDLDPGVRCCFMSGSTGAYSVEELLALGAVGFVSKPFSDLAELVRSFRDMMR